MCNKSYHEFKIIAVSNRKLCDRPFLEQIERVCEIHPEAVILREKDLTEEEYRTLAKEVMEICNHYQIPCILHRFWKIAVELECTAVHLPLPVFRVLSDEEKKKFTKIGISIHSVEGCRATRSVLSYGGTYLRDGLQERITAKRIGILKRSLPGSQHSGVWNRWNKIR